MPPRSRFARNLVLLAALENQMSEQDSDKEGQTCDMDPRHTAQTIPNASPPLSRGMVEPDLQAHIGRHLRALYDEVVNEDVPDKFLALLQELERKQAGKA